jgi:D-alanyl-D-alanine endopeptidase (penicillin-binding protein 7)
MRFFSVRVLVVLLLAAFALPAAQAVSAGKRDASSKSAKKVAHHRSASKGKKLVAANPQRALAKKKKLAAGKGRVVRVAYSGSSRKPVQRVAMASALAGVPSVMTTGDLAGYNLSRDPLALDSSAALVMDQINNEVLFEKNSSVALPIASITKLMTSVVVVEFQQNLDEILTITEEDIDRERYSHSRLRVGSQLSRANMLHIALMSSENRAASALGRNFPGGIRAFVAAMNAKARELGMTSSQFADSTGLNSANVSSARDLAKLVSAAYQHPLIRQYSTDSRYAVDPGGRTLQYRNSNGLVEKPNWDIGLQKTGYITEAGRCLVMQVHVTGRPVIMIFLDSKSKQSRLADASRIRKWLEGRAASAMSGRSQQRS